MKTYFKNHKALSCFTPPYYTFICWVFEHSKVLAELAVCRMNNRPIRPDEIFSYLYNFRTCERYISQRRDLDICAITSRKGTSMLCVCMLTKSLELLAEGPAISPPFSIMFAREPVRWQEYHTRLFPSPWVTWCVDDDVGEDNLYIDRDGSI